MMLDRDRTSKNQLCPSPIYLIDTLWPLGVNSSVLINLKDWNFFVDNLKNTPFVYINPYVQKTLALVVSGGVRGAGRVLQAPGPY